MTRPWQTWALFTLCLLVVLAAMSWVSLTVLRLESLTTRQASLEENTRLALWRMDAALSPIVTAEGSRPYFQFRTFYPTRRAYTRMYNPISPNEVLLPSPLLTFRSPYVDVHFQIGPDGALTSPQVPEGNMRDLAESSYTSHEAIERATGQLAQLRSALSRDLILAELPDDAERVRIASVGGGSAQPAAPQQLAQGGRAQAQDQPAQMEQQSAGQLVFKNYAPQLALRQQQRSQDEQDIRLGQQYDNLAIGNRLNVETNGMLPYGMPDSAVVTKTPLSTDISEGIARTFWIDEMLVLARRVTVNGDTYVQGCRLNWAALEPFLLDKIRDLFPEARLERVERNGEPNDLRMLAALPVRLVPGVPVSVAAPTWTPLRISLAVAWGCVAVAAVAVAVLMRGAVSLSERRAAFVSAVTHEMRTPLTTFRMYTDMLRRGMVPDEAKRQRYIQTLGLEADRLSHLVSNVLSYARLERNRIPRSRQRVRVGEIIQRCRDRLADRAGRDRMTLGIAVDESSGGTPHSSTETGIASPDGVLDTPVYGDPSAIEQILLNLVDNACKYASTAEDRRIDVEVARHDGRVELRVRDFGPGVARGDVGKLFRPFSKSAHDAANSAPGVGLGLALSRRLARQMDGDLRIDAAVAPGACFVLSLRRAEG